MCYSDDPIRDHLRREDRLYEALIQLPRCIKCREPIQDDDLFDFDGELVCPECIMEYVDERYKKRTTDYIS